ncbi:MAG: hypothetical protein R8G01_21750 [Ilumatobacteraceae bacterium]|nr:hypothetical protein [Ilumatobacteraceae bacterium]
MPRIALLIVAVLLVGCSRDEPVQSDAERFCGEAIENRNSLVAPPLTTDAEIDATLEFYELMGQLAPVAIADEWNDVLISLETASTLVPGDPESEQLVAKTAYATEPSAFAVKEWLFDNCRLDIPITTIAPQAAVPARTIPPPTIETTVPSDG